MPGRQAEVTSALSAPRVTVTLPVAPLVVVKVRGRASLSVMEALSAATRIWVGGARTVRVVWADRYSRETVTVYVLWG